MLEDKKKRTSSKPLPRPTQVVEKKVTHINCPGFVVFCPLRLMFICYLLSLKLFKLKLISYCISYPAF